MALNIADLVADYGAYYKPGSDNQKNLRIMLYQPAETASFFQPRPTEDTIWRGTLASVTRVLQPFQKGFTPIGDTKFEPNHFPLYKLKIDAQEYPDDLEASFVGFLAGADANRANWPFVAWWIQTLLIPKSKEDYETAEAFGGVYAAPNAGVAGAAGTAMNGLKKVINDYNTGGRTNFGNGAVAMGAIPGDDADFCTYVEEFVASLRPDVRMKLDYVFMSKSLELKYKRGKRKKYGVYFNMVESQGLYTIEDFPNVSVKGLLSHEGSSMIWATLAANRINPQKRASLSDTMIVKEFSARQISAYTDWWDALNFEVPELLFHTDQLA